MYVTVVENMSFTAKSQLGNRLPWEMMWIQHLQAMWQNRCFTKLFLSNNMTLVVRPNHWAGRRGCVFM